MERVLVLAGNYQQFRHWQHEDPEARHDARYISSENQLRGITGAHVVKTGTWWETDQRLQDLINYLVTRGDLTWDASET